MQIFEYCQRNMSRTQQTRFEELKNYHISYLYPKLARRDKFHANHLDVTLSCSYLNCYIFVIY